MGDYIVFICPMSQYYNNVLFKYTEIIYSEKFEVEYRGLENVKVNTCLNIYKIIKKRKDQKYEVESDFRIKTFFKKINKDNFTLNGFNWREELYNDNDLYLLSFGNIGKVITDEKDLVQSGYWQIKILTDKFTKEEVIELFKRYYDEKLWITNSISSPY